MKYSTRIVRVALHILLVGSVFALAGCAERDGSEVDYTFEVLKKAPDGTVEVLKKGTRKQKADDPPPPLSKYPGIGSISTGARKIRKDAATIEITYPDKTTGTLELGPKATKNIFTAAGRTACESPSMRFAPVKRTAQQVAF